MRLEDSFTEGNKDTWFTGKTGCFEIEFLLHIKELLMEYKYLQQKKLIPHIIQKHLLEDLMIIFQL